MNSWWWVPIGLAAWFLVSLAVGLCVGPALRRSTEARGAIERQLANRMFITSYPGISDRPEQTWNGQPHVEPELHGVPIGHQRPAPPTWD